MTLAELIPSVGLSGEPQLDGRLWPSGTETNLDGELVIGGVPVTTLAARFGTPCHLLAEDDVRANAAAFRDALPEAEIAFAGKSLPCRAVYRWMAETGLSLDVCSAGELAVARSVGFPAERILLHGNVKTSDDLKAALAYQVGRIVLDSADEIEQVGALALAGQRVLVRVTPGVDADTHPSIRTGTDAQHFGFPITGGVALDAVGQVLALPGLRLAGLHCHLGSQLRQAAAYEEAARRMVALAAAVRDRYGHVVDQLDLGGGFAAPSPAHEDAFDLAGFAHRLRVTLHYECAAHRLPEPRLVLEPGRSIVATAGVTLYRVATVKTSGAGRVYAAVDGGMSDNPRAALYGARYTARLVGRHSGAARRPVTVVGRHCEAGDVLARDVPLPSDVRAGDLLAVPATGAYHHAMGSNYNQVGRPPIVGVRAGTAQLLVRRETEDDLLRRDLWPVG